MQKLNLQSFDGHHQLTVKGDRDKIQEGQKVVGIFLPVLNNRQLIEKCLASLAASMPDGYLFGIVVVDGGSKDGTVEYCRDYGIQCLGNHLPDDEWPWQTSGLCKDTPNACIEALLGKHIKAENRFEFEDLYSHICWIHSDMTFPQHGWLGSLVDHYDAHPNYGILGPKTQQYEGMAEGDREGNVAPFIISVDKLKKHYQKYGWFYPPDRWFCVGYCDWEMHHRFMSFGWKSMVTSKVYVDHAMLGTRQGLHQQAPKERHDAFTYNKEMYVETYKTEDDPWNSQFKK